MKISGFNPSILTSHSEDLISLFEDLGFEKRHDDNAEEGIVSGSVRMKDASGFCVDITSTDRFPQDRTLIRMNVDDFEEGYKLLLDHGFHNALGEGTIIEAEHFRGAHMVSPSGFEIMMMKHISKD